MEIKLTSNIDLNFLKNLFLSEEKEINYDKNKEIEKKLKNSFFKFENIEEIPYNKLLSYISNVNILKIDLIMDEFYNKLNEELESFKDSNVIIICI
jgi:hypothetical protein